MSDQVCEGKRGRAGEAISSLVMFPVPGGQIGTEGHVDEGHLGEKGQGGLEAANRPKQVSMEQLDMGVSHDGAGARRMSASHFSVKDSTEGVGGGRSRNPVMMTMERE